ncbi:PREDICTED: ABC transporter G family member 25-like [Priapulus caudatus]|uniref:ABC transporter G family member 25-like n=1 Tax=Priapulus caudatus TaxID=37621 RepID=A0ABM1ESL0_PRICU|nr:PREDICTED: ABC transporter G family member 25-like [Priapulus caudatus]
MVGLNGYIAFFGMWFFLMLNAVASQSFGLLAGAYFLNQSQGVTMCVTVSLFYMMMGGFYVEHFPIWLRWGRFISPPYYTFQAFNYLELHDSPPVQCAKHNSLFATCVANNSTVITSDELLSHLDIIVPLYFDFVYLFCYTLLCYALGYFVLRCLRRPDYLVQKQT